MKRNILGIEKLLIISLTVLLLGLSEITSGAIALRGTATSATSTNTSLTINKPASVIAGDFMIVNITQTGNTNTNASRTGWTLISGARLGGAAGVRWTTILYRVADGTEGTSFAFTLGGGTSSSVGSIIAFSGVDSSIFDVTPSSLFVGAGNSISVTGITTNTNNAAVIFLAGAGGTDSDIYSNWSGITPTLTEIMDFSNNSVTNSVGAAWGTLATAGSTGNRTVDVDGNYYNGGILLALKPSSITPPTITTFSPSTGCQGASGIVITGTNFTGATAVNFNGVSATYVVNSATQITAAVPMTASTGKISVSNPGGTVQSVGSFTVIAFPSITGTSPGAICGSGILTLSATASSGTINWFAASSGGSSLATGATYSPNISTTTTYYVDATNGTCTSSPRVAVQAVAITPPTISASGAGTYCSGTTINLSSSSSNITNQYWTGPNTFYSLAQNPTVPAVTTASSGTYTVTGSALSGINLITNGNFESGNVGFTTEYILAAPTSSGLNPEGYYDIVTLPSSRHGNFCSCGDKTTGSGLQMVINGAGTESIIWSQTVNVVPNTVYQFTYWIQTVVNGDDPYPSKIQLFVNGNNAGPIYTANATTGVWKQFTYNWNSGSGVNSANLELKNENFAPGGNDFAMDDIVFQQACAASASVVVTVNAAVTAGSIGIAQTICQGNTPAALTSTAAGTGTGTITYEWQTNASGSYVTIPGATSANYSPPALSSTTSYQRRTVAVSGATCYSAYTPPVTITVTSPFAIAGGPNTVCQSSGPSAITLSGSSVGGGATIGAWSIISGGGTLSSTAQTATPATVTYTPVADYSGSVTLRLTTNASGGCSAISDRTINVTPIPTAVAGTAITTCSNSGAVNITAGSSATNYSNVTWTSNGTGTFANANSLTTATYTPSAADITAGSRILTLTATGNSPCGNAVSTKTLTITPLPAATISYTGTPFCKSLSTGQSVTRTGTSGGTYSASPSGLTLDSGTGAIIPSTSNAGTYTVTYTISTSGGCGIVTTTTSVTITTIPTAAISYSGNPLCKTVATAQPVTLSGTGAYTGGTYSSTAGLSLNTSTGAITPGTSTAGTYTVTYTIPASGGCASVPATTSVTITTLPVATFSYTGTPYCSNASNPSPTYSGGGVAGTFSSTSGLVFVSTATGQVNLAASTPGSYTVTNTIAASGGCAQVTATGSITITALPTASISYTGSPWCNDAGVQNVSLTGTSGGTYSAPAGLSINSSTGSITPSASNTGTYTVTYTIAASGGCAIVTATTSVSIIALPTATISGNATFCVSTPTDLTVSLTGTQPWNITYTDGYTIYTANGITSSPYIISVSPTASTTYSLTSVSDLNCTGATSGSATIAIPTGILYTPANDVTICKGSTTTLSITPEDKAISLNGVDGRIDIANSNAINTSIVQNRTVALWFKANNTSNRQVIYEEGAGVNGFSIFLESGSINVHAWESNTSWGQVSTAVSTGIWYHVAFVFDSNAADGIYFKGFLNGVYFGGNSDPNATDGMKAHTGDITIGQSDGIRFPDGSTPSGNYYDGYIDEFKLWNRSLTGNELYSESLNVNSGSGSGADLIAYFNFNNDSGTTVTDAVGGNDGTLFGGYTYGQETPFTPTVSWSPGGMTTLSVDVSPAVTTTYTYTLKEPNAGCETSGDITVTVNSPITPTLSSNSSVCPGNDAVFTISGTSGDIVTYSGAASGTATIGATGNVDVTVSGVTANTSLNLTNVYDGTCNLPLTGISETVTVTDSNPPLTQPLSDLTAECSVTPVAPTTTDNCAGTVTGTTSTVFPITAQGTTVVTWTFADGNGNSTTANQNIILNDLTDPTITCPASVNVNVDAGQCTASGVNLGTPVTGDNCGVASVTNNAPAIFPKGSTTVIWTVTDNRGRTATCGQTVTVADNEKPIFTSCSGNASIPVDAGLCSAQYTWTDPTANDACDGAITVVRTDASGKVSGNQFPVGNTTISYSATDAAGNTETCSFIVTVTDNVAPNITCPAGQTIFCAANIPAAYADYTAFTSAGGSASDICGIASASFTLLSEVTTTTEVTRTYQIADLAGNTKTCDQVFPISQPTVTISSLGFDNTCPGGVLTITSVVAGSVHYQWQFKAYNGSSWSVVGTDNASNSGTLANLGDQYRLLVSQTTDFSDVGCTSVSNELKFLDVTKPVFTGYAPGDQPVCVANGATSGAVYGISLDNSKVADNCTTAFSSLSIAYTISGVTTGSGTTNLTDGMIFNVGTSTVVYTVTDLSGNVETHSFDITVNESPAISAITPDATGLTPDQGSTHTYSVTAEAGYIFTWTVSKETSPGIFGSNLFSGLTGASTSITWGTTTMSGNYRITVTKEDNTTLCQVTQTLDVTVLNVFNPKVQNFGDACHGISGTTTIDWVVYTDANSVVAPGWSFDWNIYTVFGAVETLVTSGSETVTTPASKTISYSVAVGDGSEKNYRFRISSVIDSLGNDETLTSDDTDDVKIFTKPTIGF